MQVVTQWAGAIEYSRGYMLAQVFVDTFKQAISVVGNFSVSFLSASATYSLLGTEAAVGPMGTPTQPQTEVGGSSPPQPRQAPRRSIRET